MATVESFTKDRLVNIEETTIVSGSINEHGYLILKNRRGEELEAGYVVGPRGEVTYGTLTGTFLDLVGGAPRVNLDGVPFPIVIDYSVVNVALLKPMARVIVLKMDEFYILAGQIGGTVPPQPNQVSDIQTLVNETKWERDRGFHAVNRSVFSWNPVLKDARGNDIEIQEYQIWSRLPSGTLALDAIVAPTIQNEKVIGEVTTWEPGVERLVVVYAKSVLGRMSDPSIEYPHTPVEASSEIPDFPRNVQVTLNSGYFSDSGARATIEISFDPVTVTMDSGPVTIKEYALLVDGFEYLKSRTSPFRMDVESGKEFSVRVLAYSVSGVQGDTSPPVDVVAAHPETPSLTPSTPSLKSALGVTVATWDGNYLEENTSGAGRIDVEARVQETEDWTVQGSLNRKGDQLISTGDLGEIVEVRFVAYDKLGRVMNGSSISWIEVDGFSIDPSIFDDIEEAKNNAQSAIDLANSAKTTADQAQSLADEAKTTADTASSDLLALSGKTGRLIRSSTPPDGESQNEKNLWFNTSDGFLYQWSGTSWDQIVDPGVQEAANAADAATNAATTAQERADQAHSLATSANQAAETAQTAAQTAEASAQAARSIAESAESEASAAQSAAQTAQSTADQAAQAAASASGIASAKADIFIQSSPPSESMQKDTTLWIDTTGGANTPKRWSGTEWVAVTDRAALDAAQAASAAQTQANAANTLAQTAKDQADAAVADAALAQSKADDAYGKATTADGRYTVALSNPTTANATGKPEGAVWEVRAAGVAVRRYVLASGAWVQIKAGTEFIGDKAITRAQIGDAAIGTAQIGDATITNAKIGDVDAGKVTTGFLDGDRIKARSITTEKLVISPANVWPDPYFVETGAWQGTDAEMVSDPDMPGGNGLRIIARTAGQRGSYYRGSSSRLVQVEPGAQYRFRATVKQEGDPNPSSGLNVYIRGFTADGTLRLSSQMIVPSDVEPGIFTVDEVLPKLANDLHGGVTVGIHTRGPNLDGKVFTIGGASLTRMADSSLIVDGSITARKASFDEAWFNKMYGNEASIGKIQTEHLSPAVGGTLNLSANDSIVLMVENLEQANSSISETQDAVESVSTTVSEVETRLDAVTDDLGAVSETANNALDTANQAQAHASRLDAYIVIDSEGLGIYSQEDSQNHIKVGFETISIVNQGSVASYWDATEFVSPQIRTSSVQFGENHIMESGVGRTIFRVV